MMKHSYPYLISAKEEGVFWIFNGETHKKKVLDLRSVDNLKELLFFIPACEIIRFKGKNTQLDHVSAMVANENEFEDICNEYCTKDAWMIYSDEFERLCTYFEEKGIKTRLVLD